MALGSYKHDKEEFVSHNNGTTAFEVFQLFLLMPVSATSIIIASTVCEGVMRLGNSMAVL